MINLRKDPLAKIALAFVLVLGAAFIIDEPSTWPWVVGYWAVVVLIAWLKRNSP